MALRIILSLVIILTISTFSFGQRKYYKDHEGKIMDSLGYSKTRSEKINEMRSVSRNVVIYENFKESYRNNDSIIYTYHWDIRLGQVAESAKSFHPDQHINKKLPFPKLVTLTGEEIDIDKLKGKPTWINFWFTNCPPCVDEMPILNSLRNKYKESVNFIAVTFDSKEKVNKFLKKKEFNFNQVVGAKKYLRDDLKMNSFPVNIFLDRDGIARFIMKAFRIH